MRTRPLRDVRKTTGWRTSIAVTLLPTLLLPSLLLAAEKSVATTEQAVDVFARGRGGYHTYRIPAIVSTQRGTLLAFCEGRKSGSGDAGNIDMLLSRSSDGGATWSPAKVIWDDGGNTCGNPAPVVDRQTGTVWLLMTWNLGTDHERDIMAGSSRDVRHVFVTSSQDDGVTWAEPRKISETTRKSHWRWYATGPGNAIQLTRGKHKGRLLIPANHSDHSDPSKHPFRSHVIYSDDGGMSWQLGGVHEEKTNESAVVERTDGSILQAMRSYHGKNRRAMAVSRDGGESWGKVYLDESLDTPVCQANMLRYSWPDNGSNEKSRILFSSPAGTSRSHMTIWVSYDEGKTWPVRKLIHEGGAAYSNMVPLPNDRLGLLYEKDGYQSISFVTVEMSGLEAKHEETKKLPDIPQDVTSFGAAVIDDSLYTYGGHRGAAHQYSRESQAHTLYRLDLKKRTWKALGDGPPLQGLALVAHGDDLYRIGGFTAKNKPGEDHDLFSQASVSKYSTKTSKWSAMPDMPTARSSFDAAVLENTIYVVGGWELQGGSEAEWSKTAYALNLADDSPQWQALPEPPFRHRALSVAAYDGKIYAIGGMKEHGGPTTDVYIYDPANKKWSQGPSLQGEPINGFGSAAFATGGRLYVSTYEGHLQRLSRDGKQFEIIRELENARFFHRMLPLSAQELVTVGGASMETGKFSELDVIRVPDK